MSVLGLVSGALCMPVQGDGDFVSERFNYPYWIWSLAPLFHLIKAHQFYEAFSRIHRAPVERPYDTILLPYYDFA